jgi:hypothetical protein
MLVRKLAVVAIAASVALGTAGCTFNSPVATAIQYSPGDGADATVKGVAARNFVYLVNAEGNGALIGSLVNTTDTPAFPTISSGSMTDPLAINAGAKIDFGYNGKAAIQLGVTAKAGTIIEVTVTVEGKSKTLNVPVLDGTFSEYASILPQNEPANNQGSKRPSPKN